MKVAVAADGTTMEFIHSDAAVGLLGGLGEVSMRRASHVEPWANLSIPARTNFIADNKDAPICLAFGAFQMPDGTTLKLAASWFADMSPVGGRTLGPFPTKTAALSAEVEWIERNALCQVKSNSPSA